MKKRFFASFLFLTVALTSCGSIVPSLSPSVAPSVAPSVSPSVAPSVEPSQQPSVSPSVAPSVTPSVEPSQQPSVAPSVAPSVSPSVAPSVAPSVTPSVSPSVSPSVAPSEEPSGGDSRTSEQYERWINSWSQPGHLYMHYLRPNASLSDYDDWGIWIWPNSPKDLEGSLWGAANDACLQTVPHRMTNSRMTNIGGSGKDIDEYGVIYDIDLSRTDIIGGKTGTPVSFEGCTKVGFLVAQLSSMDGTKHWTSDGGANQYIKKFNEKWRANNTMHLFFTQGAVSAYEFNSGAEVEINPTIDDTTGKYRSVEARISDKYAGKTIPTSTSFKSLGNGYQIFVASFCDSNGDGMGDIRGIINSLDYLQNYMHAQVLWLTPVQDCESYHGYDTVDYYHISDKFGTDEDYQELLDKCHERGMKVMMDLVLNHTSKNNIWYQASQKADVSKDPASGNNVNWRNIYHWKFKGDKVWYYQSGSYKQVNVENHPDWYKDGESNYYYYGKFGSGMPELNYDNQETRDLVINLAKYWMEKGVDGYRLDAVKHIYMKDEVANFGNDIVVSDIGSKTYYDEQLQKVVTTNFDYSSDVTRNVEFWKEFSGELKKVNSNCFLVGENFDGYGARIAPYYQGMDSQFDFSNFYHIDEWAYQKKDGANPQNYGEKQESDSYTYFRSSSDNSDIWENGQKVFNGNYPTGHRTDFINGAFTSNHDTERAINHVNSTSRVNVKNGNVTISVTNVTGQAAQIGKAKVAAALTVLNPGLSWIYYGDELGMTSNTKDHYSKYGNENNVDLWYRQPYKWGDSTITPSYKFGAYTVEWDSYNANTLKSQAEQKTIASSLLNYYKNLTAAKLLFGSSQKYVGRSSSNSNVVYYQVQGGNGTFHVYVNTSGSNASVTMTGTPKAWINGDGSTTGSKGTLKAYSAVVCK